VSGRSAPDDVVFSPSSTVVRRGRRIRACVRCGLNPAADDIYVCSDCRADPNATFEQRIAEESATGYRDQRALLVAVFGWHGGWWTLGGSR
jgi:hypothetical protein